MSTVPGAAEETGRRRDAIHAAGGNTPGWDGMIPKLLETEEFQSTVMPSTWRQVHVV